MKSRVVLVVLFAVLPGLYAQASGSLSGLMRDSSETPALRYFLWAQHEFNEGRREEAGAALERAADFSGELSDISFLLAKIYEHENKSRHLVLKALEKAIAVSYWKYYTEVQARFMAAEQLVVLRNYQEAINHLTHIPESADKAALRLTALKGICLHSVGSDIIAESPALKKAEFRQAILESLGRYPRDPRAIRIFFEYAESEISSEDRSMNSDADNYLLELVLRQLHLFVEADPDLAWMASPFIRDRAEARRLLSAYRAGSFGPVKQTGDFQPHPASIPPALELSLISEEQAIDEFFSLPLIDNRLITAISSLLLGEDSKNLFMQKLLIFSGVITSDSDRDGIPESRALYHDGALREFYLDEDQDRIYDFYILFINGVPQWAYQGQIPGFSGQDFSFSENRDRTLIQWERYPYISRVEIGGIVYIPMPMEFRYEPVLFDELAGSETLSGLVFPRLNSSRPRLDSRTLVLHSMQIQRPSLEFEGAVEWIDLNYGIPWRAVEFINGQPIAITEYEDGRPVLQWVDLDRDSRMETVRRFRKSDYSEDDPLNYQKIIEFSMSDWDGDGLFEYAEEHLPDGSIIYSWDMDGSGIRNYSEHKAGNNINE
jgi:tetratricopeptide (TPR) repeat protein